MFPGTCLSSGLFQWILSTGHNMFARQHVFIVNIVLKDVILYITLTVNTSHERTETTVVQRDSSRASVSM